MHFPITTTINPQDSPSSSSWYLFYGSIELNQRLLNRFITRILDKPAQTLSLLFSLVCSIAHSSNQIVALSNSSSTDPFLLGINPKRKISPYGLQESADFVVAVIRSASKRIRGRRIFNPYALFEALKVRDIDSNRCLVTATTNKSARIRRNP